MLERPSYATDAEWATALSEQLGINKMVALRYAKQVRAREEIMEEISRCNDVQDLLQVVRKMADRLYRVEPLI